MTTRDRLGPEELRQVVVSFRDGLRTHQATINRLNVYPVPDGDTGTNMALTLDSVVAELDDADHELGSTCKAISHGSLMGARGNSGVILSQILRGVADTWLEQGVDRGADGHCVVAALRAASDGAYGAVMRPVEGTILTVVRASAEGAEALADDEPSLLDVLEAAHAAGADALARTPELLPVLADAGVVDAGGTGFMLLLDALLHVTDGRAMPEATETAGADLDALAAVAASAHGEGADDEANLSGLRYEVMYFLEAPDDTVPHFKNVWAGIGDSIVVVGGDGIWNCHIHTDDIGSSIEAALDCGRPRNIRVTDLLEQVEEERWVREGSSEPEPPPAREPVETAVVAISTGDGIRRIFHSLGVQAIVSGGQSMNPATADVLEAVESVNADHVVILPNNKNIIPVAEQVSALTKKAVLVIPTRGIAEGFAALMEYDPEAPVEVNAEAMTEAAERVVAGEVTRAVRSSTCEVGPIAEGDWLGIARSGITAVEADAAAAAIVLLGRLMAESHEIVTLIEGEGASPAETRRVTEWLAENHPTVACEIHHGGQALYPYFVGIE